jgi:fused signal recognition particle receptor
MFGILKKKFSKLVESITKRTEEKEEIREKKIERPEVEEKKIEVPEIKEEVIEQIEVPKPIEKEEAPVTIQPVEEEKIEEIKPAPVEVPEIKEEIPKIEPEKKIEVTEPIEEKPIEVKPIIKEEIPKLKTKEEIPEIIPEKKIEEKKSWIARVKEKIVKQVIEKKLEESDLEPILNELERDLIEADAAYEVAQKIKNDLKTSLTGRGIKRGKEKEVINNALRQSLLEILSVPKIDFEEIIKKAKAENRPAMLLFFGVNGVGKSLNLTKTARWLQNKGHRPILAAGDTYRAAGDTQLELYAEKINVPVIKHQRGADSCAVIFDARKAAEARGYDVVLGDTSGRMHTKKDLMDELEKIVRVNKPDLKILVLDSLSGSDVMQQFEFFDKTVKVDAVMFSKVDVNEKGGNILSICHSFKRPILFLGMGQEMDDLMEYSPEKFVDNMLA